jgi:Fe-S-cluster containining protein
MASDSYRDLLNRADLHFDSVMKEQASNLQCGRGCSLCCHGLFEIGAADIPLLAEGLGKLDGRTRNGIVGRARKIVEKYEHPNLRECSPEEKEEFFDRSDSVPCPNLSPEGACLVYESRPLICRTFGLPLRNAETYIGDVCGLNFIGAPQSDLDRAAWDLQWEDELGPEDEYTIPEAILIAERLRKG